MINFKKFYDELILECPNHITNTWRNSWMWEKNNTQTNKIKYHYLIEYDDIGFSYQNINDTDIDISCDDFNGKYRIDIKTRYGVHNFWIFKEDKWKYIEEYLKNIIISEYKSIEFLYSTLKLSDDAYHEKEPSKLYNRMNKEFRKYKVEKLLK